MDFAKIKQKVSDVRYHDGIVSFGFGLVDGTPTFFILDTYEDDREETISSLEFKSTTELIEQKAKFLASIRPASETKDSYIRKRNMEEYLNVVEQIESWKEGHELEEVKPLHEEVKEYDELSSEEDEETKEYYEFEEDEEEYDEFEEEARLSEKERTSNMFRKNRKLEKVASPFEKYDEFVDYAY